MKMNADLERERAQASFSPEKLTNLLDGGKTQRRRHLESIIANDPTGIFNNDDNYYLHRTDRHVRSVAKAVRLIELCRQLGIDGKDGHVYSSEEWPWLIHALGDDLPLALHWIMFVPNIVSLCDDEQQALWLPLCRDFRMIGCYAQTEVGHGSNVRALETTATFLPESEGGMPGGSWVINSPTITSYKAWPGTLGRNANHAMVIARLIDGQGVDRGVHNFLVPLRSMIDHSLLKGVTTGDLGPKIGYNSMDNGFASFDHVVIPRRNMAMRFASVDEQGQYTKTTVSEAASKVAYITMMQVRAYIVDEAGKNLAKACTICIRYSAVRRQGFRGDDESTELQILDYRQQQHRIFQLLANAYCFFFTGKLLLARLKDIESRLVHNSQPPVQKVEVTDLHASSSSLKSFTTMITADGMEECRKACGGHGFLQASGLPEAFTTYLQNPTVEGDNHMLPQQVVKVLLKLVQAVQRGDNLAAYQSCDSGLLIPSLKAIMTGAVESCVAQSEQNMRSLPLLLQAFRHRAARLLVGVATLMEAKITQEDRAPHEAWNDGLIEMARASRAYAQMILLKNFMEGIDKETTLGASEVAVLQQLARLCALAWMEKDLGDFLEDGYLSAQQAQWVRSSVLATLDALRPDAVALVDSWDFSDFRLRSALGRWDGDVYNALLDVARGDPLNAVEPGPGYVHLKKLIVDGIGDYKNAGVTPTASRL